MRSWRDMFTPKRIIILAAVVILLLLFSKQLATALLPFLVGLTFAILLEPLISFLERRIRLPRGIAVLTVLVAVGLIAWYLLFLVVGKVSSELMDLALLLPQ